MGIKNLLKFLNEFPELVNKTKLEDYKKKKIAVDISILLYQVVISIRSSGADLKNKKGEITSHILGLFNKTILLLKRDIIPVFVFDGKPPPFKNNVLAYRNENRKRYLEKMLNAKTEQERIKYFKRTVYISKDQYTDCKNLLKVMGIPYVVAPEEADSQCAYLCKNNLVDGVLTEDMDILTFGSKNVVRNLSSYKKDPIEIKLDDILQKLDFSYENFVDFCILLGCDYLDNLSDISPNVIYKYYSQYKDISKTLEELKKNGYSVNVNMNYREIKDYFLKSRNYNVIKEDDLKMIKPDKNVLCELLVDKYGLVKYKIEKKLEFLIDFHKEKKLIDV